LGIALVEEKRKGGVKVIKVEGGMEKDKEVIVRHKLVSSKWGKWKHDNFSRD